MAATADHSVRRTLGTGAPDRLAVALWCCGLV